MKSAFSTCSNLRLKTYIDVGYNYVNLTYWLEKDPMMEGYNFVNVVITYKYHSGPLEIIQV